MAGASDRLASARSAVEQSCRLLLDPSPEVLDQCTQVLSVAVREMAATRDQAQQLKGDSGFLAEVRELRTQVLLAGSLLETAAAYHAKWNRILGSMLQGYTARGEPPAVTLPGRLAVEG